MTLQQSSAGYFSSMKALQNLTMEFHTPDLTKVKPTNTTTEHIESMSHKIKLYQMHLEKKSVITACSLFWKIRFIENAR